MNGTITSTELCEIIRVSGEAGAKFIRFGEIELDFFDSPSWDGMELTQPVVEPIKNVVHNDNNEYDYTESDIMDAEHDDLLTSDPLEFERLQLNDEE